MRTQSHRPQNSKCHVHISKVYVSGHSPHRCVVATAKRTDVHAFDVIQSKLSRSKNRPSSTEGIAGRAVAAASWLGAAKASQAGRSLRTTLSGISSPALEHSGPPIGGISSWHTGAGHRWRLGTADHLASPSLADASPRHRTRLLRRVTGLKRRRPRRTRFSPGGIPSCFDKQGITRTCKRTTDHRGINERVSSVLKISLAHCSTSLMCPCCMKIGIESNKFACEWTLITSMRCCHRKKE